MAPSLSGISESIAINPPNTWGNKDFAYHIKPGPLAPNKASRLRKSEGVAAGSVWSWIYIMFNAMSKRILYRIILRTIPPPFPPGLWALFNALLLRGSTPAPSRPCLFREELAHAYEGRRHYSLLLIICPCLGMCSRL